MGVCASSPKKTQVVTKEDQKLDFETYRDAIIKDNDEESNKIIEVIANITEFIKHNNQSETQTLLSKYLFINPNGKFKTVVGSRFGNMNFEGTIQKNGQFYLTYKKERQIIEDAYSAKIFEGQIEVKAENYKNLIQVTGSIFEDGPNGREQKNDTFLVDFTQDYWVGDYFYKVKLVALKVFMKFENDTFQGVGLDERGFFVIFGVNENSVVKLTQIYIDKEESELERNTLIYKGEIKDKKITGTITNKEFTEEVKFNLSYFNYKNEI